MGGGNSSSLSLPHRQGALWRCVVPLLCADCSRQRRGGCGGSWHTRLRQLGPASFCLFGKPTQALPPVFKDRFPVGRVIALVLLPPERKLCKARRVFVSTEQDKRPRGTAAFKRTRAPQHSLGRIYLVYEGAMRYFKAGSASLLVCWELALISSEGRLLPS